MWESFQPKVVAVSRKSPSEGSLGLNEFDNPDGEAEKEDEGTKVEKAEQDADKKVEDYSEAVDNIDSIIVTKGEETFNEGKTAAKKKVTFAQGNSLVLVHHLNDEEEVN